MELQNLINIVRESRRSVCVVIAVALANFATAKASEVELVCKVAMPTNVGHATDVKGVQHANALCMMDATYAPRPDYPYEARSRRVTGSGLFRLAIGNTGQVTQVTTSKSTGNATLDVPAVRAFQQWRFKPGKWKEVIIPVAFTVQEVWVPVLRW